LQPGAQKNDPTRGGRPKRKRKRKPARNFGGLADRLRLKMVGMILLPVVLLAAVGAVVLYTRLLQGPISLSRMVESVEAGVSAALTDLTAEISDVRLELNDDNRFEVRLMNLVLSDSSGARVVAAPVASVTLNRTSLLFGQIVPSQIQLIDPRLIVTYRAKSGLSLQLAEQLIEPPELVSEGRREPLQAREKTDGRLSADAGAAGPVAASPPGTAGPGKINFAQLVTRLNARMRDSRSNHAKLKTVGVRNASVLLDYEGRRSEWLIAEATVDLRHDTGRSTVSGAARIQSDRGPWVMSFRTVDSERTNVVRLAMSVRDLVPNSISGAAPALNLLKTLDMPVGVDATMQLSDTGDIDVATLGVELSAGKIVLPEVSRTPLLIEGCVVNLSYDGATEQFSIAPSTVRWSDSYLTIRGEVAAMAEDRSTDTSAGSRRGKTWAYDLQAVDGVLAAEEFGIAGLLVDSFQSRGRLLPVQGQLDLDHFELKAAGTEVIASGAVHSGGKDASTRVDAQVTSRDLNVVKALWPKSMVPAARTWIGTHVVGGFIRSGSMKIVSGQYTAEESQSVSAQGERISMALEIGDLSLRTTALDGGLASAERALVRLENDVLEVTVPEAKVQTTAGAEVNVKPLRIGAVDLYGDKPLAEIAVKVRTSLTNALLVAKEQQPKWFESQTLPLDQISGDVKGDVKLTVPLLDDEPGKQVAVQGKISIRDFKSTKKVENFVIKGGSFDIDASESALEGKGEVLVNGVPAKLSWQHILGAPMENQPPLKVSMRLDNADRDQLDIDINDVVDGEFPVTVSVQMRANQPPGIHVHADLTSADLLMSQIAWRKPAGQSAIMDFEVATGDGNRKELQNIRVVGSGLAIEGWAAIGDDQRMREFYFPDFSIDTVTRLQLQGKLDKKLIWNIRAVGPTYDARAFFKSLFSRDDLSTMRPAARRPAKGVDLEAKIDNVIGGDGVTLRNMTASMSGRNGTLQTLRINGRFDNDRKAAALLKRVGGKRKLFVESSDAGRMFKLAQFYPNMIGGRARVEVDLDGHGAASRTGTLWVEDFRVLGDQVASEVVAGASGGAKRRVKREVFQFDRMRLPFQVGHDQFVIQESYLRGPVLGASIRGKVDYRTKRVNLGGTYIPLQGINSALCGIPLLGAIITGPKCEGVLGITFAVQGPMSKPQVIVNPLSLVAPGIFRDIFQLTNPSTSVIPRIDAPVNKSAGDNVRASSALSKGSKAQRRSRETSPSAPTIDGWTSQSK
jgi:AsmA-like C-terminal region/Protein of unknown function